MSKNTVYMIGVPKDGYLPTEYEISFQSWKHWCDKNDCQIFILDQPVVPLEDMHIIWQRYFMFDIFDANGIESNQTLIVDADTIIHPDCPNFFNETEDKYCLVHDDGSYDWILRGMEHYQKRIYKGGWFNFWEYGNSGFQIVNNKHRDFFKYQLDFYNKHKNTIQEIQSKFGIGTDQTPLNFNLREQNIDMKLLPYKYNMTCMPKKEILDEDMIFTKLGWIYHFNGLPDKKVTVPRWMEKTYRYLYG